jgi:hypothetical protein
MGINRTRRVARRWAGFVEKPIAYSGHSSSEHRRSPLIDPTLKYCNFADRSSVLLHMKVPTYVVHPNGLSGFLGAVLAGPIVTVIPNFQSQFPAGSCEGVMKTTATRLHRKVANVITGATLIVAWLVMDAIIIRRHDVHLHWQSIYVLLWCLSWLLHAGQSVRMVHPIKSAHPRIDCNTD